MFKSKKFNDSVVLAFLECSCYSFRIRSSGKKNPLSQMCVVSYSNFGNWIAFGPLRIRCLFYIWTTLLITVHTFAFVIISLHIRKYAILFHLAWLNSKKLSFTLFILYSLKGWTAALVCDSVYSLLDSGWVYSRALTNATPKSPEHHQKIPKIRKSVVVQHVGVGVNKFLGV